MNKGIKLLAEYLILFIVFGIFFTNSIVWNAKQSKKIEILEEIVQSLEYDNESLLHYKTVCEQRTREQHEINTDHGSVIQYLKETVPDLKQAFDLEEIQDIKAN